jgi:polyphosphate kinase
MNFYRIASESFFVRARVEAARNGKKVTAFVEMKERFDEEIRKAQAGKRAFVILKVDNLEDPAIRSQMEIDRFLKEKADGDA